MHNGTANTHNVNVKKVVNNNYRWWPINYVRFHKSIKWFLLHESIKYDFRIKIRVSNIITNVDAAPFNNRQTHTAIFFLFSCFSWSVTSSCGTFFLLSQPIFFAIWRLSIQAHNFFSSVLFNSHWIDRFLSIQFLCLRLLLVCIDGGCCHHSSNYSQHRSP